MDINALFYAQSKRLPYEKAMALFLEILREIGGLYLQQVPLGAITMIMERRAF